MVFTNEKVDTREEGREITNRNKDEPIAEIVQPSKVEDSGMVIARIK